MAARITPSKGKKPDKLMRDALVLSLHEEAKNSEGVMTKRLRLVASRLVDQAIEGNVTAAKEIFDRVDGKVPVPIGAPKDDDNVEPYEVVRGLLSHINEQGRGLPNGNDVKEKAAKSNGRANGKAKQETA